MASLFNFGSSSPDYVGVNGANVTRKTEGSFLGLFPGTPEYVIAPTSAPGTPIGSSATSSPTPTPIHGPGVEVRISVPGLLHLHGSVSLPQVQELALVALPWMLRFLEGRFPPCGTTPKSTSTPNQSQSTGRDDDGLADLEARVSDIEQRLHHDAK